MPNRCIRYKPQEKFEGKVFYQAKGYVTTTLSTGDFPAKNMCIEMGIHLFKLLSTCIYYKIQTPGYRGIRKVQLLSTMGNPPGNRAAMWVFACEADRRESSKKQNVLKNA